MSDETERLDDIGSELEAMNHMSLTDDRREKRDRRKLSQQMRDEMTSLYKMVREASVGSEVKCPACRKRFVKTTYHKSFCSNGKTSKGGNCKDRYWNTIDNRKAAWAERKAK